jgi:hypothetical protein
MVYSVTTQNFAGAHANGDAQWGAVSSGNNISALHLQSTKLNALSNLPVMLLHICKIM